MLVETLQAAVRAYYHVLGGQRIELTASGATVGGFRFDPEEGEPERTVVLVHGLGDASTTWYRLVPALRGEARLLLPDLPPFGLAELAERYALAPHEHAELLATVLDEHAVGPTTVVGQSMGGWVVQWLAHERPELVDAAVLVATAGARLEGSFDAVDLLTPHSPEAAQRYLDALWHERPLGISAVLGEVLDRLHSPEIRAFLAKTAREHTLDEEQMAEIEVPLHVVWGREDDLLDEGTPAFFAEHWGGPVDRSYLARAGHMVHQERPGALLAVLAGVVDRADERGRRRLSVELS